MAITATLLTEGASTTDGSSYATASVTLTANRLVLLFLGVGDAAAGGADEAPSSVTSTGATWVQIAFDQRGTSSQAHAVFRTMVASNQTGAITVNFTNPQDALTWHVVEVDGIDPAGTNGSGAIAEVVTGEGTSSGSIALTGVSAGNSSIGGVQMNSSTPANFTGFGAGFTQVGTTQGVGSPSISSAVGFSSGGTASMGVTFAGAQNWSGTVVELVLAPVVVVGWPVHRLYFSEAQPRDTPAWVDISSYVRTVSWRSPTRRSDRDRFDAATLTVVLNNEDRRFDPTYAAGAYYPDFKLMRRLRWDVTFGSTTYTKFEGHIDRIPQEYQPPRVATATIHATDALGVVLSKARLPDSPYAFQINSESPPLWWRMNEGAGSTSLADSGGGTDKAPATITGTAPEFGAASLVHGDPSGAIQWVSGGVGVVAPNPPENILPAGYPFTVEGWFQRPTIGSADADILNAWGIGSELVRIRIGGTATGGTMIGRLVMSVGGFTAGTTVLRRVESTILVDDNEIHHFMAVFTNATTFALYIDGFNSTGTTTVSGGGAPAGFQWRNVYIANQAPGSADQTFGGVLDELAVYTFAKTLSDATTHYDFGTDPWAGQTTGQRLGTILDLISFPVGDRNIDTGNSTVQAASFAGQTLLEHAQLLEKTEAGLLFMEAGEVRFVGRHNRYLSPYDTLQATFGDSTGESEYTDLAYDYDYGSIVNDVRLTREGGATQVATDATSDADYYTATYEDDGFLNQTDSELLDRANWLLGRLKDPILRVESLRVEPTPSNGLFATVVPLKVGDRIRVKRTPQDISPAIDQELHIEGIEVEAGNLHWLMTLRVSPADTVDYWIWDTALWGETTRWIF